MCLIKMSERVNGSQLAPSEEEGNNVTFLNEYICTYVLVFFFSSDKPEFFFISELLCRYLTIYRTAVRKVGKKKQKTKNIQRGLLIFNEGFKLRNRQCGNIWSLKHTLINNE